MKIGYASILYLTDEMNVCLMLTLGRFNIQGIILTYGECE